MKLLKSKKADIFVPMLTIITILAFSILAVSIAHNNREREKELPVGAQAASLIKTYNEAEHAYFYVQKSAEFSQIYAFSVLYTTMGYPKKNTCDKSIADKLIILSSKCGDFNPEESYKTQFNETLKSYLIQYESQYLISQDQETQDKYMKALSNSLPGKTIISPNSAKTTATNAIKSLNITDFKITKENQIVSFNPVKYNLEYSSNDSYCETQINITLPSFDLSDFSKAYSIISECKSTITDCEAKFKLEFPEATVTLQGSLWLINTNNKDYPIKFLFDPSQSLPRNTISAFKPSG